MQAHAPEAVAIEQESAETQSLYGMDRKETATFGRMCLLSRRMVERGVRFVQLYHGAGSKWDAHSGIEANHAGLCQATDLPIAGLLKDLKQRGLLDQTLVVWWRIWTNSDVGKRQWTRSQSHGVHDVDGRRWRPRGSNDWLHG
jgi:hypothetical protein